MVPDRRLADLSDDDRQKAESWLVRFDQKWAEGALRDRAGRIPPDSEWRLPALAEMVKIDLERQWALGNRLGLEAYLRDYPELGAPANVSADLIHAEYEVRRQFGAPVDLADYARRFPARIEELRGLIASGRSSLFLRARPSSGVEQSEARRHAPAAAQELPEQFGRYRIMKRLGAGGMGSVYLAEDTLLKRSVALKVAHVGGSEKSQVLERFHREAVAAAGLDHPYLCKVYDVGVIDGVHYLTMEYIEGTTLADLIDGQSNFPQRQVAAIVGKLALALQEAHAKGVVHRDLKPANVMIKKAGQKAPVIVDFGLAQQIDEGGMRLTQTGQAMGTPYYMAIEQVKGELDAIGPACDIYALGVMLYELLTGVVPFDGPNPMVVIAMILTTQPERPSTRRPDLDPRLEAICLKAMAKDIKDRYASMAELAAALSDYLKASAAAPTNMPADVRPAAPTTATSPSHKQGSDTLMGQFFEKLAAENAAASIIDSKPRPVVASIPLPVTDSQADRRPSRGRVLVAVSMLGVLLLGVVIYVETDKRRYKIVINGPTAERKRKPTLNGMAPSSPSRSTEVVTTPSGSWTNSVGMKMVRIESGTFTMGADVCEREKPPHSVRITKAFALGAHEVTQTQYRTVTGTNPSEFDGPDDLPVESVPWLDAVRFCNKLSRREQREPYYQIGGTEVAILGGNGYRLPTEAEWEYACGAETSDLDTVAWFSGNCGRRTHPVGQKRPNGRGLYDMQGNVWEWCQDWYDADYYKSSPPTDDPPGPLRRRAHTLRGCGWYDAPELCHPTHREWLYYKPQPDSGSGTIGFRVAATYSPEPIVPSGNP